MIEIFGACTSINVRKVLWVSKILGVDYKVCDIKKLDREVLHQLNPNGLAPVIIDTNGESQFVLWESNTIIRYLAERYANDDEFYPTDSIKRAHINQWIDWQASDLNAAWRPVFQTRFRNDSSFSEQQVAQSIQNWNRLIAILEGQLQSGQKYIAANHITLADVGICLSINRWIESKVSQPSAFPCIMNYFNSFNEVSGFTEYVNNGVP
ncbi:glutathione S-transferase family protein [Agaribacter flavus]|uniref:Glutathione S-transferase family protein n=1 Tax=Agaribacter flavus TaxID=1902781 RepID=A0ABV7FU35_9ALTE